MHGGPRVGLGDDQQPLLQRLAGTPPGVIDDSARAAGLVAAQDAEPGAGHGLEQASSPVARPAVLPVAEEGEVVVGQPAQQLDRVGDVLVRHRQRARRAAGGGQLVGDARRPAGASCGQSSTASRTSVSTRCSSLLQLVARPRRCGPGRSRPGSSSPPGRRRWRRPAPRRRRPRSARRAARGAPPPAGAPAGARRSWWAVSRAVTESTRNGMSSVTICSTVCGWSSSGALMSQLQLAGHPLRRPARGAPARRRASPAAV